MNSITQFEDILAWQKAKILTLQIYAALQDVSDRRFKDQAQAAAVSIMNNIAEGYERGSDREFRRFLFIAKGSCGEVRSMIDLGLELGYLSKAQHDESHELSLEVAKLISGFIKTL